MPNPDPLTPERLDELDRLCDAATPGPYTLRLNLANDGAGGHVVLKHEFWELGIDESGKGIALVVGRTGHNAKYFAALDPATVRALVAGCRERDDLRQVWLPCDQTIQCAFCDWIDWPTNDGTTPPHSDDCPIGYMRNQWDRDKAKAARLAGEVERLTASLAAIADMPHSNPTGNTLSGPCPKCIAEEVLKPHGVQYDRHANMGVAPQRCLAAICVDASGGVPTATEVDERDRLRAALAESQAEVNELKSRKTMTMLLPVTRPSFVIEEEEEE